jgi:S-formylglutathione hydrolase FrmB
VLASVAVVLTLLTAAGMVNDYYAYYPTVASLFDGGVHNRTSFAELRRRGLLTHLHAAAVPVGGPTTVVPDEGRIISVFIPPTFSGFHARHALVYLPPAWFQRPRPRLPTVMLLGGTPGSPSDWFRAGFADVTSNRWAATHNGAAPVLVVPDLNGSFMGDTECVDRPRALAETYLVADVRDFMIRTFDAPPEPGMWALGGLSEGGTCSLVLALRHPNLFSAFADYAGDPRPNLGSARASLRSLYNGSVQVQQSYDPAALLASHRYPGLGAWFELGSHDGRIAPTSRLVGLASSAGADVHFVLRSGSHTFWVFHEAFADSLPWLWQRFVLQSAANPAPAPVLAAPATRRLVPRVRTGPKARPPVPLIGRIRAKAAP